MELFAPWYVLVLALVLDLVVGDPAHPAHPVRLLGIAVERLEPRFRALSMSLVASGGIFALVLVAGTFLATALAVALATAMHPWLGAALQVILVAVCLASRSLAQAARGVGGALVAGDVELARSRVAMIVSRDPESLDQASITRAAVETVAENFVDGVFAPLFWAALLGAPGAMAHKMSSTLDSMVGYRNERYEEFGKVSARLDDVLCFVPARLSIPVIALAAQVLFGTGRRSLITGLFEGGNHKSPNAGRPEAAFAGALGVRMIGPGMYHGKLVDKPWIGRGNRLPEPGDVERACSLLFVSSIAGTALFAVFLLAINAV
ncbi:MAG: adenosylcobinamide-phosphate synthase CbiB [Desulfatibacillaceae bacterium]